MAAGFYLFLIRYHQTLRIAVSRCTNKCCTIFFDLEVTQLIVKLIFSFLQKIKWSWKAGAYHNCLIVYLFDKVSTETTVFCIREGRW